MNNSTLKELLTNRTKVGLAFIYLAGLGWITELIIPFQKIDNKVTILVGVLILAEASFIVGVAILGKPVYKALKARLTDSISRRRQPPS